MLTEKYKWLENIGTLPKLVSAALQYLGVKEIPGAKSNPVIMDMAKGLGVSAIYTNDDQSWCAVFINHLIRITGKPMVDPLGDKYNLLRARWLSQWGEPVDKGDERLGDIVVLKRDGGGHVFILIAVTTDNKLVGIGGNQGNKVSISTFDPSRVVAIRRHYSTGTPPTSAKKYIVDDTGEISSNES